MALTYGASVTLQAVGVPYAWTTAVNVALWALMGFSLLRALTMPRVGQPIQSHDADGASYIVRLPIHSWRGLIQAIFLPQYHARYETRAIVDGDEAWYIHQGKFRKRSTGGRRLLEQGDAQEIAPLTDAHRAKLDALSGQFSVTGLRDCRRFEKLCRVK